LVGYAMTSDGEACMNWPERMRLAMEYIESNLNGSVTIEDAAKIACCSKYHFHRVFYSYFDITFAEYVRKRRFTLAAADVISGQKVMDVALKYGYDSPNAFTRAFRSLHGINPSEARSSQAKLVTYNRASFPPETRDFAKMNYKIVERPAFKIIGKSKRFEFEDFAKNGPKFWKAYVASADYKALCQLTNGQPGSVTGAPLLTAFFPEEKSKQDVFLDVLGVELDADKPAKPFEAHSVPAATYAEFECSYRSSMKTNRYIYGEWFSATGFERDGDKPDIVGYFPMPYRHFSEMGVRWWVPVVRRQ